LSVEFTYLSQLARTYLTGPPATSPPPTEVDWEEVVRLLAAQNLATSLAPLIDDDAAPESVKTRLRSQARNYSRWSALLGFESSRVLHALTEAGIRSVLLKGRALARTVYSRPEHRISVDIDILVPRSSLTQALEILRELGYTTSPTVRHPTFYEQHHFHLIVENADGVIIELHWDLAKPEGYCQFDLDGFVARCRSIELEGCSVLVPSDEDQLLHTAYQLLCDGYADLRRVLDTALVLRRGHVDPVVLARLARDQGLATSLWVLLELQRATLSEPIPPELERAVRPAAFVRRCLKSLNLSSGSAARDAKHHTGFNQLMLCLCAPDPGTASLELRRYVFVGRGQWLEMGYDPEAPPSRMRRIAIGARRCLSVLRILAYQAWRLILPPAWIRID
jgi:hypothetical protein